MATMTPETLEAVKQVLAALISLHVSEEVDDFLGQVVDDLDEVVKPPAPEEPSSVVIEELEEDPRAQEGPALVSPAPEPSPLRRPHCAEPAQQQADNARAPQGASVADADAARVVEPPVEPQTQSPQGAPDDEVGADWARVEPELEEARRLYRLSSEKENSALAALEEFLQRHGAAGERQAGPWVARGRNRREELDAVAKLRAERACRARQAKEAAMRAAEEAARKAAEEEAARLARKRFQEAKRARERAEEAARRVQEEAQRRLQAEEERLAQARAAERAARKELEGTKCFMCGEPGVKKSKNCPNRARHRPRGPQRA